MLIQEDHEQSLKLTVSLRDGKPPAPLRRAASAELPPSSVRSLRERVVATVEEHDDAEYMRVGRAWCRHKTEAWGGHGRSL